MSTTAVPLRPVSRSGLIWLWLSLLVLIAGSAVWALTLSHAPQITLTTLTPGSGKHPGDTDMAIIKYEGRLPDGTVFDSNDAAPLPVGRMIPGFADGLRQMQIGGHYRLFIPSELAYGEKGAGPIPPNSDLTFDVELKDIKTEAEVRAMMLMQQQMQQQMQQRGGGAGGPPPGAGRR